MKFNVDSIIFKACKASLCGEQLNVGPVVLVNRLKKNENHITEVVI